MELIMSWLLLLLFVCRSFDNDYSCHVMGTGAPKWSFMDPSNPTTGGLVATFDPVPVSVSADPYWCPALPDGSMQPRSISYNITCDPVISHGKGGGTPQRPKVPRTAQRKRSAHPSPLSHNNNGVHVPPGAQVTMVTAAKMDNYCAATAVFSSGLACGKAADWF